ncbi:hypothetical protein HMPREF1551_00689 [Capnocytophaga sp. oral taxon 863 str. F0517]|nr:hypothetical protein HMPREF1551_00689 [Capnocytophaga sp. oral taxon 863 str. F0517]
MYKGTKIKKSKEIIYCFSQKSKEKIPRCNWLFQKIFVNLCLHSKT